MIALVSLHTGVLLAAVVLICFTLFGAIVAWDNRWERQQREKREQARLERKTTKRWD